MNTWILGAVMVVSLVGFIWWLVSQANKQAPKGGKNEAKQLLSKIKTH